MPQAIRSRFRLAGGWSGWSACAAAICSRVSKYLTRSLADRAALTAAERLSPVSPIAASTSAFIDPSGVTGRQ